MLLVDKDIKSLAKEGKLISKNYVEENVGAVSVDLSVGCIIDEHGKELPTYDLGPGRLAIVRTNEELSIPTDLVGRVGEKNSVMRLGLKVDAPLYQPGHTTYSFLRVQNLTGESIHIEKGFRIAQICFEKLTSEPEVPYNRQEGASFNDESKYVGYGKYAKIYNSLVKKIDDSKNELDDMKSSIYANVLTLMGIMVAVFSLVSVNFGNAMGNDITVKHMALINIALSLCIVVMLGTVALIVNHCRKKWFIVVYALIVIALAALVFFLSF